MTAALPMYDWPELRAATDAFWSAWRSALFEQGVKAPEKLDRTRPARQIWRDPDLLVAQTCGWPYVDQLSDVVRLVATPIYAVEGCEGPLYSSVVVVRQDDPAERLADVVGRCVAVNGFDSLSGWRTLVADLPGAVETTVTGAHRASMAAVVDGVADAAAIDAVCWSYAARCDPAIHAALRPIARTRMLRALPFVTSKRRSDAEVEAIFSALQCTFADLDAAEAIAPLRLVGATAATPEDYAPIAALRR